MRALRSWNGCGERRRRIRCASQPWKQTNLMMPRRHRTNPPHCARSRAAGSILSSRRDCSSAFVIASAMSDATNPCVRAHVEPLDAALLVLTVGLLHRTMTGSDVQIVARERRTHILAAGSDEPNAGVSQQAGFVCGADGNRITDEPCPSRSRAPLHLLQPRSSRDLAAARSHPRC